MMSKQLQYALIVRDSRENRLAVVCTHRSPRTGTGHNAVAPSFLRYCRSTLALYPDGISIETVSLEGWRPGVDVEAQPPVLWVEKAEQEGHLVHSFPLP